MTVVVVQNVRTSIRHVQIDPAVVVVVARTGPHAVLAMCDPGSRRHVLERAVPAIAVKAMASLLRDGGIVQRTAVDEEDVDPAVVVEIEEQAARTHRLDEVLVGARAVDMPEVDAGLASDVCIPDSGVGLRADSLRVLSGEGAAN